MTDNVNKSTMLSNQNFNVVLAVTSALITTFGICYLARKRRQSKKNFEEVGVVTEINIYPVKSFSGIYLDEAECSLRGLKNGPLRDRKWMVVDTNNKFVTAREEPSLQLIVPSLSDDGQELILTAKDQQPLRLPAIADISQKLIHTSVFGLDICAYECGKEAEAWLANIFNSKEYKLVVHHDSLQGRKLADHRKWKDKSLYKDESLFSDLTQYLMIGESSLEDLNTKLEKPVTMKRFRPNIVVKGRSAYDEENWSEIKIGGAHLYQTHLCGRCRMTLVDPETGIMAHDEPLKTLCKYRKVDESHPDAKTLGSTPVFGVNFNVVNVGNIKIGDKIHAVLK